MSEKDKIREELEGLSPLLLSVKKSSRPPFYMPEGYFQRLPDDVLRRIRAEEGLAREARPAAPGGPGRRAWLSWLRQPRYAASLGMAAVLIAFGAYWFWPQAAASSLEEAMGAISGEEANAYIAEHIGAFELELMMEVVVGEAEDIPRIEVLPGIDQEDIDQYLDEFIEDIGLDEFDELL